MLDRDTILSKKNLRSETVDVPEWGGEVVVRELTGRERSIYEAGFSDSVAGDFREQTLTEKTKRFEDLRAKIIVMATIDDKGSRIFKDSDIDAVNELSGSALDRLASVIMRLSGYTKDEQDRLKKSSPGNGALSTDLH
jgi:Phage tail assembly chaperone